MDKEKTFLEKMNISTKEFKWFLGLILLIFSIPFLLTNDYFTLLDFTSTGNIGDTIGGITAPFLSVLGSVLVYLAFKEQIKANTLVQEQFIQQDFNLLFFRLMDNQQTKILNYSTIEGREYKGFEALDLINEKLLNEMKNQMCFWGRHIICEYTEKIADDYFVRLFTQDRMISDCSSFEEAKKFKENILALNNYNERWEYIKVYVGSTYHESPNSKNVLESIGSVYFYKIDFNKRNDLYERAYHEVYIKHGTFLDNYFNGIQYLLKTLGTKKDDGVYFDYFKTNISSSEKSIIFYYLAAGESKKELTMQIKELKLLDGLDINRRFFIDAPSSIEFEKELEDVFNQ